jgi:hypothetical protein
MSLLARTLAAAALAAAAMPTIAGRVDVAVAPSNFTDAGNAVWEERPNAEALARHLQRLGERHLPADHVLSVELLDLDLAGTLDLRGTGPVRTVRGRTDFPSIRLRYTLSAPGRPAVTREEEVRDIQFTRGLSSDRNQPLAYEKRMLDRWFAERFAAPL